MLKNFKLTIFEIEIPKNQKSKKLTALRYSDCVGWVSPTLTHAIITYYITQYGCFNWWKSHLDSFLAIRINRCHKNIPIISYKYTSKWSKLVLVKSTQHNRNRVGFSGFSKIRDFLLKYIYRILEIYFCYYYRFSSS